MILSAVQPGILACSGGLLGFCIGLCPRLSRIFLRPAAKLTLILQTLYFV